MLYETDKSKLYAELQQGFYDECRKMDSDGRCLECGENFYIVEGICCKNSQDGDLPKSVCDDVNAGCVDQAQDGSCSRCASSHFLLDTQCCPNGEIGFDGTCTAGGVWDCVEYADAGGTCSTCKPGHHIDELDGSQSCCPDRWFSFEGTGPCRPFHDKC